MYSKEEKEMILSEFHASGMASVPGGDSPQARSRNTRFATP